MDPTTGRGAELRRQVRDGYCHVPGVVPDDLIERVRAFADGAADGLSDEQKERTRFQGSMIRVMEHEEMLPFVFPEPGRALRSSSPWGGDPSSYTGEPVQVFLMYYLIDTNRRNGCLRVIPGSHRRRHKLHGLPPAHGLELEAAGGHHPALQPDPDEVDVPVRAGDLVIGDARLLHSAHPNHSEQRRTVITLWFLPTYPNLPERLHAFYGSRGVRDGKPEGWSDAGWRELRGVLAWYDGPVQPGEGSRIPDVRLA